MNWKLIIAALAILAAAQRRLDMAIAVETFQGGFVQQQMMNADIGGHRQAAGLGVTNQCRAGAAADLLHMQAHASGLAQYQGS